MNTQRTHPPADAMPLAREIARQVEIILGGLLAMMEIRTHLLGLFAAPLCRRINRIRERLVRLLINLAEGRLPRPHTPRPAPAEPRTRKPVIPTPQAHLWIIRKLGWQASGFASQLNTLLHAPGMAATIAASPGATRTLRPLCRLLGIDLPAQLRPAPRPTPPPRPSARPASPPRPAPRPAPSAPPGTPDRPLPAYVRATVRAWKRHEPKTT